MFPRSLPLPLPRPRRPLHPAVLFQLFNTTLENGALLLVHEIEALRGHYIEAQERLSLVAQARSPLELIQLQRDLVPESRRRLSRDHAVRLALLDALAEDWRQTLS